MLHVPADRLDIDRPLRLDFSLAPQQPPALGDNRSWASHQTAPSALQLAPHHQTTYADDCCAKRCPDDGAPQKVFQNNHPFIAALMLLNVGLDLVLIRTIP